MIIRIVIILILLLVVPMSTFVIAERQNVTNPEKVYTYEMMERDIHELKKIYPEIIQIKSIGKTKFDRNIWAVKLGNGEINIKINGSHHAREWITTNLIMKMIEEYAYSYKNEEYVYGMDTKILDKVSIWFVPMVNPDGVTLQQRGLDAFPEKYHSKLVGMNGGSDDFTRWKANGEGIDLNKQYPAEWDNLSNVSNEPHFKSYKGESPIQAKEVQAVIDFTKEIDPQIALAYHTTGRILYWYFFNNPENLERDYCIAKKFSYMTGYEMVPKHTVRKSSGGGFSDWFIKEFNKPGLTAELSYYVKESNPPLSVFADEWKRHKSAGLMLSNEGLKIYNEMTMFPFHNYLNYNYRCDIENNMFEFLEKQLLDN
ncbi:M14 family zinc carboxypeptidase [Evansella sp. AB-P1]|uniref:M14 family zinc carboxypeptidase n=1 Tax=Evansella sp. AB-P1 TaxID=3037653 RepID=UPI00241D19EF|nr:M14 family zinc carboxypeptidase [Evansella sp. AB-P1]MDG5787114.1 M14 family zinc carboxypeptidase [Evansella sp. AB-P1]